ncbi:MAG: hypothetical protein IIB58_05040 [Planctomycetes bacterium]|nr:hypothetical protein [Planctomycetota bacterium]
MFRSNVEPISENLLKEAQVAERLASPLTRLAGVCSLIVLVGWVWGGLWAGDRASDSILLNNFSMYFGFQMEIQDSSAPGLAPIDEDPPPNLDDVDDPLAEALRLIEQERKRKPNVGSTVRTTLRERQQEFQTSMLRMQYAQGVIAVSWLVVMLLAGVFLLCAALSALLGSHRARAWHRQVVYWTFLAAASTAGGIWALEQWGGFPPIPDPWILAKIAAVQSSYAIAIIVALIVTHRRAATS